MVHGRGGTGQESISRVPGFASAFFGTSQTPAFSGKPIIFGKLEATSPPISVAYVYAQQRATSDSAIALAEPLAPARPPSPRRRSRRCTPVPIG